MPLCGNLAFSRVFCKSARNKNFYKIDLIRAIGGNWVEFSTKSAYKQHEFPLEYIYIILCLLSFCWQLIWSWAWDPVEHWCPPIVPIATDGPDQRSGWMHNSEIATPTRHGSSQVHSISEEGHYSKD